MCKQLLKLRWPVNAVLSNQNVVKPADAKILEMKEEHWQIIADILNSFQRLKIVISLFSAKNMPSSFIVYPTLWKFITVDLAAQQTDSAANL
jgi:hypothetical protein